MALTTTIASADADSYVTVEEADSYLAGRSQVLDYSTWDLLDTSEKEDRLRLAAEILDSFPFRGIRATNEQARAFPRIFRGSDLWPEDDNEDVPASEADLLSNRYDTWDDLTEVADDLGVDYPEIPEAVKKAQMELALQVADYIYGLSPNDTGSSPREAVWVQTGEMAVSTAAVNPSAVVAGRLIVRDALGADSLIYYLLKPYLSRMRGFVV